jgi:hypothetical protein
MSSHSCKPRSAVTRISGKQMPLDWWHNSLQMEAPPYLLRVSVVDERVGPLLAGHNDQDSGVNIKGAVLLRQIHFR